MSSDFDESKADRALGGILLLAPVSSSEWCITFLPTDGPVKGLSYFASKPEVISCLSATGVKDESANLINQFDFDTDELRTFEFIIETAPLSVLYSFGLISSIK